MLEGRFNTSRSGRAGQTPRRIAVTALHQGRRGRPANGAGANDGQAGLVSNIWTVQYSNLTAELQCSICALRSRGGTKRQRSYWMPPAAIDCHQRPGRRRPRALDMLDLLPLTPRESPVARNRNRKGARSNGRMVEWSKPAKLDGRRFSTRSEGPGQRNCRLLDLPLWPLSRLFSGLEYIGPLVVRPAPVSLQQPSSTPRSALPSRVNHQPAHGTPAVGGVT